MSRLAEIRSLDTLNGGRLFFGIERDQLKSTLHENITASQADGLDEDGQQSSVFATGLVRQIERFEDVRLATSLDSG